MARRRQSIADDLIELTAKLPWWVGLLLAVMSYVVLHRLAAQGLPQASGQDVFAAARGGLISTFVYFGQYVLPGLFGIGALVSIISRLKRIKLHWDVTSGNRGVGEISWKEFEELIGEHFRRSGYHVEETGSGADGGVDLVLQKEGGKYFVQCKHWKAFKVGIKPVRELLGVMVGSGAAGGYMVTSGEFTVDAIKFAQENRIELIAGKQLRRILKTKKADVIGSGPDGRLNFIKTKSRYGYSAALKSLLVSLIVSLAAVFLFFSWSPILPQEIANSNIVKKIRTFLPSQEKVEIPVIQQAKPIITKNAYSEKEILAAQDELQKSHENTINNQQDKLLFEIQLNNGRTLFAKNVTKIGETLSFESDNGLLVSMNMQEVKRVRKLIRQ